MMAPSSCVRRFRNPTLCGQTGCPIFTFESSVVFGVDIYEYWTFSLELALVLLIRHSFFCEVDSDRMRLAPGLVRAIDLSFLWSRQMEQLQESGVAEERKTRGRHRSLEAKAAILKATLYLLERKPLRKVTADAIAKRAGVSKATIYKWWPNKNLVALEAYLDGMTARVPTPDTGSAETDFTVQLKSLTAFYTSTVGRPFCQFIAEGQNDPGFLALFRERFLYARRDAARVMWRRGVERGDIWEGYRWGDRPRSNLWADDLPIACRPRITERLGVGGDDQGNIWWPETL